MVLSLQFLILVVLLVQLHYSDSTPCYEYECNAGACVQLEDYTYRFCIHKPCRGELRRKRQETPRYLYRVLRDDENPENGLHPKDPEATKSVQSHVGCGSRNNYRSQYISTTGNIQAARDWAAKGNGNNIRIVRIDTEVLRRHNVPIIDLSNANSSVLPGVMARNFAHRYQEVLIEGTIPSEAITLESLTPLVSIDPCVCQM